MNRSGIVAACAALSLAACAHQEGSFPSVPAVVETPSVGVEGDAADDPAIWVSPAASQSRVIGTQKQGGLFVYDLDGQVVQDLPGGRPNNVDLRDGFAWSDGMGPVVATSDRSDNAIVLWKLDPATGRLDPTPRARIPSGYGEVYGVCLGRMGEDFVAVATSKIGEVGVWRLSPAGATVAGEKIAAYALGSIAEGCVVDDAAGAYYVAQELVGLWRASLADAAGAGRLLVDKVGGGNLRADVEGVAIWDAGDAARGYIVVSVQGRSRYALYDRAAPHAYRGAFTIRASAAADGVSGTDGIDVVSAPLGDRFPRGLLVAQDDVNTDPTATQNFKYISWADVETALQLD